jgi:hypothetical protein
MLFPFNFLGSSATSPLLDVYPSALAAYSIRKLRSAYSGSAIRVRRSSDNAEQDIGFVNGLLDTSSLLTFCGVGNGFVTTWYDQSGSGLDAVQLAAVRQPQIVTLGVLDTLNSKPVIRNPQRDVVRFFEIPLSTLQARPISIIAAGKIYQLPVSNSAFYMGGKTQTGGGGRYEFYVDNSTGFTVVRRNTAGATSVNNGAFSTNPFIQGGYYGSSLLTNRFNGVNGSTAISDLNQFNTNDNFILLTGNPDQPFFLPEVGMFEYIFYLTDQTSNAVGIENNINSYYSIF